MRTFGRMVIRSLLTSARLGRLALLVGAVLLAFGGAGLMTPHFAGQAPFVAVICLLLLLLLWRSRRASGGEADEVLAMPGRSGSKRTNPAGPRRSELADALASCKSAFIAVGLFSGVINLLMLSGSIYMLEVYDRVLPSRSVPTLVGLSILVTILYAGQGLLDFIRGRVLVRIGSAIDESLSARVYSTVLKAPLKVGRGNDGQQPVRDLDSVRGFLSGPGPGALFDLPWIPLYVAVIFAFHVLLGVTALVGSIILVILTLVAERQTREHVKAGTRAGAARNGVADAGYRNAEVIAALGMGGPFVERWRHAHSNHLDEQRSVGDIAGGFLAVSRVLRMMLQSSMLGIGALLVIDQQATGGIIITASILSGRALAPVDLAISNWKGFISARQGWQRLNKVLSALPEQVQRLPLPAPRSGVVMLSVSIAAPGTQRMLVQDASFGVEAGHAVGIVGPSGSGKSTLVRALVGAWQPVAGRIKLDGADLEQWSPAHRGRHIGYLPQDVELFAGTVAENIARFEPDPEPALVIAAAKAAGAHDLIVGFREGYDTQIGEQGEALSAGQRQRIALARALYRDPFMVVLDEPNSNLDTEGEQALNIAIMSVRQRGGVVVLVAHRPSVLITVDFLLAMNQGRVAAFGLKDDVLAKLFPRPQPAVATGGPRLRLATDEGQKPTPDAAANSQ